MRGLTSTIVGGILLLALGGYIYWYEWDTPATPVEQKDKAFASVEADKIEELRIKSAGGETATAVKAADGWQLVEPIKTDADASELSSVTSNLSTLEVQSVVDENPGDLARYGLNPPRVDVAFRLKDQKEFRHLLLGEKTPTGGDLYAKLPDDKKVFLVSSFLENTFNRTPFDLRDKRILEFEREKVERVELASGGNIVELVRSGTDWKIAKPVAARGDYGAIEGIVTRLSSAQMQRIVDPEPTDLKKYGLDKPSATATVSAGSARASVALGTTEAGSVYAKDASRPMVFAVEESLATDLKKGLSDFRRKDVFDARPFNMQKVEITRGPESLVFEKSKDKDGKETWRRAGKDADAAKIEDLLTKLANLRATEYAPGTNAVLEAPEVIVSVSFDGKSEMVKLGRAGTDAFAGRADEPGAAKLETTPYEDVLKALDAFR